MLLKPIASLCRDEVEDLVRVHAKMFAFLRYSRMHLGCDEEDAHAFAGRHWHQFRAVALDYLAVKLAIAEHATAASN